MKYPSNQKIKGSQGYNGFKLTDSKTYLKYRLGIVSSILGKAVRKNLYAYHFVVESTKTAASAVYDIRSLNNNACAYIDYEQEDGAHEIFIFTRESVEDVELVLKQHYKEYELCGEYDVLNHTDLIRLVRLCHECCVDNESDGSSKRYLNKSQLTAADKNREICMLPSILDKSAA